MAGSTIIQELPLPVIRRNDLIEILLMA